MKRLLILAALAVLGFSPGAVAQCAGGLLPNCTPVTNLQTTDLVLVWQNGQNPHSRKATLSDIQLSSVPWSAPPPIGNVTPNTGAFTTLSATSTVSGAGITALFASPPAIGGTVPAAGAFTTLSATGNVTFTGGTINGTAIGGVTPAAGAFTTLSANAPGIALSLTGTGAMLFPSGTTGQRPDTGNAGEARYNSTTGRYEFGVGGSWVNHVRLSGDTMTGALAMGANDLTFLPTLGSVSVGLKASTNNYGINLKNYGAALDGTTNDNSAYAAARTAAHGLAGSGGSVVISASPGHQDVTVVPTYSSPPLVWEMGGLTFPSGTTPVTNVTSGDLVSSYFNGGKYYQRTDPSGNPFSPLLRIDYTGPGNSTGIIGVNYIQAVNGTAFPFGVVSTMTLNQTGSGQAVGVASVITRTTGATPGFSLFTQIMDQTGKPPASASQSVGYEMDLNNNGPENVATLHSPVAGSRVGLDVVGATQTSSAWQGTHTYTAPVIVQPTTPNGFVYPLNASCISGAVEPTWPLSAGTVADGTCVWAFGTTLATQISRAIGITARDSTVSFGAGLLAEGPYYDAILEMSTATLNTATNPTAAAIRVAANMPIDFSGDGTLANQNKHTLLYDAGTTSLLYQVGGVTKAAISATGVYSSGASAGVNCPAGVTAGTVVVVGGIVTHC